MCVTILWQTNRSVRNTTGENCQRCKAVVLERTKPGPGELQGVRFFVVNLT